MGYEKGDTIDAYCYWLPIGDDFSIQYSAGPISGFGHGLFVSVWNDSEYDLFHME
jgi:hypothetical protein